MTFSRGDIVICVLAGDYGKPRPAVVVQSNLFNETHASITVCPLTSYLIDAPLFRVQVEAEQTTGLEVTSQIMVDKILALKIDKVREKIGRLSPDQLNQLNSALLLWLDL